MKAQFDMRVLNIALRSAASPTPIAFWSEVTALQPSIVVPVCNSSDTLGKPLERLIRDIQNDWQHMKLYWSTTAAEMMDEILSSCCAKDAATVWWPFGSCATTASTTL